MRQLSALALPGIGEIGADADVAAEIAAALITAGLSLREGHVVVVASKIVAKAEGRTVPAAGRDAAITAESVRLVAARALPDGRLTRVVQTRQGPVLAAAGVDASDVAEGTVLLLPADPDGSARRLRARLRHLTGAKVGVLITDTSGRPWRSGVSDFCLGSAGVQVLDDRRGTPDASGRTLTVTIRNVADEIACLADLVKGKGAGTPVAVVDGLAEFVTDDDGPGAADLVRTGPTDWFGHGRVEAVQAALARADVPVEPSHAITPSIQDEPLPPRLARVLALAATSGADIEAADDIVVTGPALAVGRAVERLLTAAWAHDLPLAEPEIREASAGRAVATLAVHVHPQ